MSAALLPCKDLLNWLPQVQRLASQPDVQGHQLLAIQMAMTTQTEIGRPTNKKNKWPNTINAPPPP